MTHSIRLVATFATAALIAVGCTEEPSIPLDPGDGGSISLDVGPDLGIEDAGVPSADAGLADLGPPEVGGADAGMPLGPACGSPGQVLRNLEDPEIVEMLDGCVVLRSSVYVRYGTYSGDYFAPLSSVRVIEGRVTIGDFTGTLTLAGFERLERVEGLFYLAVDSPLDLAPLGRLREARGGITLFSNYTEDMTIVTPELTTVGGNFILSGFVMATSLEGAFPRLERVVGDFHVSHNGFTNAEAQMLADRVEVGGTITIERNPIE